MLTEVTESDGKVVLFIDELHTVVGAGASEGSLDASNMLKPMLARGELHTIGATTLNEYRKYIEKDAALERRFQPVIVDQPTVEDTISICVACASATRFITACGSRTRRWCRRRALEPLHRRSLPARQGYRSRRRSRVEAAHGDRLNAGGPR